MGLNVNLHKMLGADLPKKVECPKCKRKLDPGFDDYDIEDSHTNPKPGIWSLMAYCFNCEHDFKLKFRVKLEVVR